MALSREQRDTIRRARDCHARGHVRVRTQLDDDIVRRVNGNASGGEPEPTTIAQPRADGRSSRWTRELVVEAISTWREETGRRPTSVQWNTQAEDGLPIYHVVRKFFDSWAAGLAAAGYDEEAEALSLASLAARLDAASRTLGEARHAYNTAAESFLAHPLTREAMQHEMTAEPPC